MTENVHLEVQDRFKRSAERDRRLIGVNLERLRNDRNRADYDAHVPGIVNVGKGAIRPADQVMAALNRI